MRGRLTDSGEKSVDNTLDEHKSSGIAKLLLFLPLAVISSCAGTQQRHCGMKLQNQRMSNSYHFNTIIQGTHISELMK